MEKYDTAEQAIDDNTTQCYTHIHTHTHTHTNSKHVISIAFPLQQRLHKRASMLCYTYRGADKSLARPGRKKTTATEDFEFHISYL
jgi:hypothetical protein